MDSNKTKLAVVGGGPGGYAAAFYAADRGMDVTLIDPDVNPGGVCLYRGCIPSKALLHVAKLVNESAEASEWGIGFNKPKINLKKLREFKNGVVEKLTGGLGQLTKQRGIDFIRGTAKFKDRNTLEITRDNGDTGSLSFENAIIATGSQPIVVPSLAIDSPRLLDSTTALDLESVPKSLLVIGGGYIGLELGTVYAALGSRVTVVEMTSGLLPGVDRDLVAPLKKRLADQFEDIWLDTTVTALKAQKNGTKASFKGENAPGRDKIFERVLMSVGRKPNTGGVGLENIGIELTDRGFVRVDDARRTNIENVFAIGDVAGEPMLAHKASHEGRVAVDAIAGDNAAFEPRAIPAVVFTDPEIAWCGLTQTEAKERGVEVEIAKFPWGASGRAMTLGRSDGLTKLLIEPKSERILGVGIVGPGAGELIGEGALAVEMAAVASDLSMTIHAHPTLSETVMEAADVFLGHSTHYYRPKRKR